MDEVAGSAQRPRGTLLTTLRRLLKHSLYGLAAFAALLLICAMGDLDPVPSRVVAVSGKLHFFTLAAAAADSAKLDWNQLRTLDVKTGAAPPALKQLNGKMVGMAGFMVPLEDDDDNVSEFLLVPWTGACIHTPPPPPNQIVDVITNGQKIKVDIDDPIWVNARLQISTVKSPYGNVAFQMTNGSVRPYDEN